LDEKTRAIVSRGTKVGVFPQVVAGKRKAKRVTSRYFFMMRPRKGFLGGQNLNTEDSEK